MEMIISALIRAQNSQAIAASQIFLKEYYRVDYLMGI